MMGGELFVLFALLLSPDGSRQVSDVALVPSREACSLIVSELNESPRKPEGMSFGCRLAKSRVET